MRTRHARRAANSTEDDDEHRARAEHTVDQEAREAEQEGRGDDLDRLRQRVAEAVVGRLAITEIHWGTNHGVTGPAARAAPPNSSL